MWCNQQLMWRGRLAREFPGDRQRVEHLFTRYEKLVSPLIAQPKRRRGRRGS